MIKKLLFFSLFCLISIPLYSQSIRSFSPDPVNYFKELDIFFSEADKSQAKKFIDFFEPEWNSSLNDEQKKIIIEQSNLMLKKRLRPFPDYENYLKACVAMIKNPDFAKEFNQWNSAIIRLLNSSLPRRAGDFMEISYLLTSNNVLYESPSVTWQALGGQMKFDFDTLPLIRFSNIDLIARAKGDSSVIEKTQGIYNPVLKMFVGYKGKVNWSRAGFSIDQVYANVSGYAVDITKSEYVIDTVEFFNKSLFKTALPGSYKDKLLANADSASTSYPRFASFNTSLSIKDLIKGAEYLGGFSMHGNKIIGSGNEESDATLTFYRNQKPFLVAASKVFVIRTDRIVSEEAGITIYLDTDSMYHPGLELRYQMDKSELKLIRNTRSGNQSPFFDSYHNLDIYFEELIWKTGDPLFDLVMKQAGAETKLVIESSNYFSVNRFLQIQGIMQQSPLYIIKQYGAKYSTREIYIEDLAKELKLSQNQVRMLVLDLSNQGFVSYNKREDNFLIKDKLFYYLDARSGKVDYDGIFIESTISAEANATLNLLNNDLKVRGVPYVLLSDSQNVFFVPEQQELIIKKNRDMTFNGRLRAGRIDFYGDEFYFNYDDFKIDMPDVDTMRVKVPGEKLDAKGRPELLSVTSFLERLQGTLFIDHAGNKSGKRSGGPYPYMVSDKESYVYYDNPGVYDGVYNRNDFFYKVNPFMMDSLDNFDKNGLSFKGELISAGIFKNIDESLRLQDDFSLGFTRNTGSEAYALYSGKGKYSAEIRLSNKGLQGAGKIDFLSSTTLSDEISFFPDSTNADAQDFQIREESIDGVGFPGIKANDVYVNWQHKEDKMFIRKKTKDFELYNKQAYLNGDLILTKKGLSGMGVLALGETEIISNLFNLKQTTLSADTSDFRIKSRHQASAFNFETHNMKSNVDFTKRNATFESNGAGSYIRFPINYYICFIDNFKWAMDEKEIEIGGDKINLLQSEFISVLPSQDSLRFKAQTARFNLETNVLMASGVNEILVADASINPNGEKVVVEAFAVMQPFTNAIITANTVNKYHTLRDAKIQIESRHKYKGSGTYDYRDPSGRLHKIFMDYISVDSSFQTFASGSIPDSLSFSLGTNIQYKGGIEMKAAIKNLFLKGFALISHACEHLGNNWFGFTSEIDPAGIIIPVDQPQNEFREDLVSGIYFSNEGNKFYSRFLSKKENSSDFVFQTSSGILKQDQKNNAYQIGNTEKIENPSASGSVLNMNEKSCDISLSGPATFNTDFGQFKLLADGRSDYFYQLDSLGMEMVLNLDFFFSDDALKTMAEVILSNPTLKPSDDQRPQFESSMSNLLGKKDFEKFIADLNLYGSVKKLPELLQNGITLNKVQMYWHRESDSYRSVGPISVGFTGKSTISRELNGYLQITRRKSGDIFNLYLEVSKTTWFFFNYQRGIMQAVSSDSKFNDFLNNTKPEKRVAPEKDGAAPYQYMLSTERRKADFVKKFLEFGQ
ncbi:MAG TPA: hypothetical protein PKH65_04545 [Bacteroidia bacterium]|nr:hypothetical protein [Bacteroidia bacterium]HNT79929.1 hypothetical protein [Bacteroidia bacterium]